MTYSSKRSPRGTVFPIVEAFGFPYDSESPAAFKARVDKLCPFAGGVCEKYRQYRLGYCSVPYAAGWDAGELRTYAVCDHRLDGPPVEWAMRDYFPDQSVTLVPEVTITNSPKLNIDYVAFGGSGASSDVRYIAIETQAIDLRGGSVAPAWRALEADDVANWRKYFTEEAKRKNRRQDTIDYGVNTGNVYKRLGTQVAVKGEYLKQIKVPLYVVMQYSILQQLRSRVNFAPVGECEPWDITFAGFDYDGTLEPNGQLSLVHVETVRTTLADYIRAMTSSRESGALRGEFIARVKKKLKNKKPLGQADLFS